LSGRRRRAGPTVVVFGLVGGTAVNCFDGVVERLDLWSRTALSQHSVWIRPCGRSPRRALALARTVDRVVRAGTVHPVSVCDFRIEARRFFCLVDLLSVNRPFLGCSAVCVACGSGEGSDIFRSCSQAAAGGWPGCDQECGPNWRCSISPLLSC